MGEKCISCVFWKGDRSRGYGKFGYCRLNPRWEEVRGQHSCGQHEKSLLSEIVKRGE